MKFASGFGALLTTAGALSLLAGCASSPSSRFYTLGGDAPAASTMPASFYIEVPPVDMPPQVAKNQLVVQTSAAQVQVLEQERWSSLPADEVRRALSSDLTQQLGAIDVYNTPRPDSVPVYRVKVNVQRFESWPGVAGGDRCRLERARRRFAGRAHVPDGRAPAGRRRLRRARRGASQGGRPARYRDLRGRARGEHRPGDGGDGRACFVGECHREKRQGAGARGFVACFALSGGERVGGLNKWADRAASASGWVLSPSHNAVISKSPWRQCGRLRSFPRPISLKTRKKKR